MENELEENKEVVKIGENISMNTQFVYKNKIMERLLQSVNMVKDVLQTNLKLRQQILKMSKDIDKANLNFTQVQKVNEELKDKIQVLTREELDDDSRGVFLE